ncbi:MAG: SH3 domain-containing protein [Clostridia bacterium]|nr:SH3 domain-containing protein [Clostridia bacterium]MBR6186785.1 SH3 domain-containing protein [Clostridia bacterium]
MKKQIIAFLFAAVLLLTALPAVLAEEEGPEGKPMTIEEMMGLNPAEWPKTMYVYTENRGKLNVRSEPKSGDNVIDQLEYGTEVIVESPVIINPEWSCIRSKKAKDGIAYVMTRYLKNSRPSDADKVAEEKANKEELNRQIKSERALEQPLLLAVRASRASGWVNFRVGPGVAADRIASLPDGRELKAIGETDKWYQAIDSETGKTGYISKNYVTVLGAVKEEPAKEQMGKLIVNGEFALQCQLPEGYSMQLINTLGTKISAFITSEDPEKPILQLSIAFDELFADVDRMNDLSEEALRGLEESFAEMNEVEISYTETAYGTKLLIAREVGDDTDFVDILSVYKGYSIEFVMTPNPEAKDQTLTDAQIQMCIDFLSEVDFVEVK